LLRTFSADLHIHTCLSPCASLDMSPRNIVRRAVEERLSIIAVTDHNSAENAPAVIGAAAGSGLFVIPGMEITTSEEVHLLGLFESIEDALRVQDAVYQYLMPGENDEKVFGMQVIANAQDEVLGFNKRMLAGATSLNLNASIALIHRHNGIAVLCHIDRPAYGIIGQLGFIPPDIAADSIEISRHMNIDDARAAYRDYLRFPIISSSDAHEIEDIGKAATTFLMQEINFHELRLAFSGSGGRSIIR